MTYYLLARERKLLAFFITLSTCSNIDSTESSKEDEKEMVHKFNPKFAPKYAAYLIQMKAN